MYWICLRKHTKPALYGESRLRLQETITVSGFVMNAVCPNQTDYSQVNSANPVQQNDKTLMTRICQLYQTAGMTGAQVSLCLLHSGPHSGWRMQRATAMPEPCKVSTGRWILWVWLSPSLAFSLSLSLSRTTRRLSVQGHTCKVQTLDRLTSVASLAVLKRQLFLPEDRALSTSNGGHSLGRLD